MGKIRRFSACLLAILSTIVFTQPAEAATQRVNYYISGDCYTYYNQYYEYAMFEEVLDWDCKITVKVTPTKPARSVSLQYMSDSGKWVNEFQAKTNSKGVAVLEFDPYCEDDYYCDGSWDYRVYVAKSGSYKATNSVVWTMNFYPYNY